MKNWPNFGQILQKSTNKLRISDLKKKSLQLKNGGGGGYYRIWEGVII